MIPPERLDDLLLRVASTDDELLMARRLHHECYVLNGYIEPQADGIFMDEYSGHSTYLLCGRIAQAQGRTVCRLVGTMRMIECSESGFQAISKFAGARSLGSDAVDFTRTVELSGLATVRGELVAKALFRYAIRWSDARGDSHWLAVLDERTWRLFRNRYMFLFDRIGEPTFYMGASTAPYLMDRQRQQDFMRAETSARAQYLYGAPMGCPPDNIEIPFTLDARL